MIAGVVTGAGLDQAADPGSYARAILNILADFSEEKTGLADVQSAMLNILEDSGTEKLRLEAAQKATLNILADFGGESAKLADVQRAVLNVLEDFAGEKTRLESTQKAVLNILADFDTEKNKLDQTNREMAREIAERKRAEQRVVQRTAQLEAANKELEAFSYSVSHDLRAPLRSIDGFSQALLEDCRDALDERGTEYLRRVRAATQRMGGLIDDLLGLSRVTRAEMHREPVSLSEMARSAAEEMKRVQPERSVEFVIQDGLVAEGDGRLLRVVLENLLGNALKFSAPHPSARIEFGSRKQPDGRVAYFVRDDGVGFDMTYADKLFGAFQRLHSSAEFMGSGIGLASVQRIVHRHGGRVWAEGAVERGATFYFTVQ